MNFDLALLSENLIKMNISVSREQIEALDRFAAMLIERNRSVNLTAVTDARGIAVKHFADSLSAMTVCDFVPGTGVLDIGTGAGFPGMPLLIANPGIKMTFLDSVGKKLDFISDCLDELSLEGEIINTRAETLARDAGYRDSFDIVVSRAVADMSRLCEYALPLVKPGGVFIAMKGAQGSEELEEALRAVSLLGAEVCEDRKISLTDGERHLAVIRKISATPAVYPRASAKIKKSPL
jgi:16S rRNA (guanine527-N7)-methyltransferase